MQPKLTHEVRLGDCLEVLQGIESESIDACVTDPPYGLSFMGKKWDYDVPSVEVWAEVLRVLKPGGHLLAFAGTRTQHRMAVRIEDAGFEIRDMIAWVYGSGFPKSMDVSKAIDKSTGENLSRQKRFVDWMRSTGITAKQIKDATGTDMADRYLTAGSQPAIATADLFDKMRPYLPEVPEEIERLVAERTGIEWTAYKNRPVVGKGSSAISTRKDLRIDNGTVWGAKSSEFDITAPATESAKQWQGWGTALKPALEPVTVARKPLVGTVAANVLQYGTGAINVDGCRVVDEVETWPASRSYHSARGPKPRVAHGSGGGVTMSTGDAPAGRWPANFIHDGSDEVVGLLGDQARFFYVPKASKADRDEGLRGFEARRNNERKADGKSIMEPGDSVRQNHHPTVKPTDLMQYLVRLVTPPGGLVLDPFSGSGSTGKACVIEDFGFLGIERDPEYHEIATARIADARQQRAHSLF